MLVVISLLMFGYTQSQYTPASYTTKEYSTKSSQKSSSQSKSTHSSKTSTGILEEMIGQEMTYQPEGGLGIRFKKAIFTDRDFSYIRTPSLIEETYIRRKNQLLNFIDPPSLYQQKESVSSEKIPSLYLSSTFYKTKSDQPIESPPPIQGKKPNEVYFQIGNPLQQPFQFLNEQQLQQQLHQLQQQNQLGNAGQQAIQQQQLPQKEGGQGQQHLQNINEFPPDNFYLNFAINARPAYELQGEIIEKIEQRSIIESILEKKAKKHIQENSQRLKKIFWQKDWNQPEFLSKISYSYLPKADFATVVEDIVPNKIQDMKKSSSNYKLFNQEIDVTPRDIVNFEDMEILIPRFETITITNKNRKSTIYIKEILSTSPEISFYFQGISNPDMPISILPQKSIDIRVIFVPETYGEFQCAIQIVIDQSNLKNSQTSSSFQQQVILLQKVKGQVTQNQYKVEPFYLSDTQFLEKDQTYQIPLVISNQMTQDYLIINEMYSTEDFLQLKWPNGSPIQSKVDYQSLNDNTQSQFLKINPLGRKQIASVTFNGSDFGDYVGTVHLLTSLNEIIRVPFNFHVTSDLIRFVPQIVDFGIIDLYDEQLKMNLRFRVNSNVDQYSIVDIYLPINDDRLDFSIPELKKINNGKPIKKQFQDIQLGVIGLNPSKKEGIIDSKIIMIIQPFSNNPGGIVGNVIRIEIPIIGLVTNQTTLTSNNSTLQKNKTSQVQQKQKEKKGSVLETNDFEIYPQQQEVAKFDVSGYVLNKGVVIFKPQLKDALLSQPFIIHNFFNHSIVIKDIINHNPEFKINVQSKLKSSLVKTHLQLGEQLSENPFCLKPGDQLQVGTIELNTSSLKIAQGQKLIHIQANNTLVPLLVKIYDRNMLCRWEEDFNSIKFVQCSLGYDLNFGHIALNESKKKRLNMTNMNPVDIYYENTIKSFSDDLIVYLEKIVHLSGNVVQEFDTPNLETSENIANSKLIIGQKKQKSSLKIRFQSLHTYCFVFYLNTKEARSNKGKIEFQANPNETQSFTINYEYSSNEGSLTIMPSTLRISPAFPGMVQVKNITVKSTFKVNTMIKHVYCNDPRINTLMFNPVILANNKTEIAQIKFDPGKQTHQGQIQEVDLQQILGNQIQNINPVLQQNLLNLINMQQNQQPNQPNQAMAIFQGQLPGQIQLNNMKGSIINLQMNGQNGQGQNGQNRMNQLTYNDILQYREQQKFWDQLGPLGKTEINAKITIETNVIDKLELPVKAYLTKPSIILEDQVDFGTVQIGTQSSRNIKLINPSEEILLVQLFLLDESTFKLDYNQDQDKSFDQEDESTSILELLKVKNQIEEDSFCNSQGAMTNGSNQDYINMKCNNNNNNNRDMSKNKKEKLSYLALVCSQRLKQGGNDFSTDYEEYLVNQKSNIYNICKFIINLASDPSIDSKRVDSIIKNQLEPFFKEVFKVEFDGTSEIGGGANNLFGLSNHNNINIPLNMTDQDQFLHGQNFYISPKYQGQVFRVEPKSNLTILDAIIFKPLAIKEDVIQMTLLLKNNLTILYPIELKGSGGTGLVEFGNQAKKIPNLMFYNNSMHDSIYIHDRYDASSFNTSSQDITKRINQHIQSQSFKLRADNTKDEPLSFLNSSSRFFTDKMNPAKAPQLNTIQYSIEIQDLVLENTFKLGQAGITNFSLSQLNLPMTLKYLSENKLSVNSQHQRMITAKNTGNLPINIDSISLEGKGCSAYGFTIINCAPFQLQPGQIFQIYVTFISDFTVAQIKKKLILESKYFVQEYIIQVQIPSEFLQIVHQVTPLDYFGKTFASEMYFAVTFFCLLIISRIFTDIMNYFKIAIHFDLSHSMQSMSQTLKNRESKALNSSVFRKQKGEKGGPIKEDKKIQILNQIVTFDSSDPVLAQYQHQQEKFDNNTPQLMKEISALCTKKNLVILDIQKQALEAEKERRANNKMTINKYLEEKRKEEILNQQNQKDFQEVKNKKERINVEEQVDEIKEPQVKEQEEVVVNQDSEVKVETQKGPKGKHKNKNLNKIQKKLQKQENNKEKERQAHQKQNSISEQVEVQKSQIDKKEEKVEKKEVASEQLETFPDAKSKNMNEKNVQVYSQKASMDEVVEDLKQQEEGQQFVYVEKMQDFQRDPQDYYENQVLDDQVLENSEVKKQWSPKSQDNLDLRNLDKELEKVTRQNASKESSLVQQEEDSLVDTIKSEQIEKKGLLFDQKMNYDTYQDLEKEDYGVDEPYSDEEQDKREIDQREIDHINDYRRYKQGDYNDYYNLRQSTRSHQQQNEDDLYNEPYQNQKGYKQTNSGYTQYNRRPFQQREQQQQIRYQSGAYGSQNFQKSRGGTVPVSQGISREQDYYQRRVGSSNNMLNQNTQYYQGRGQSSFNFNYARRGGNTQYQKQSSNYYYDEDKSYDRRGSYNYTGTLGNQTSKKDQNLNDGSSMHKRMVINTLKNQTNPYKYRPRGGPSTYYRQSAEEDDYQDSQGDQYYNNYSYNVPYQKRKDDNIDSSQFYKFYQQKKEVRTSQEDNQEDNYDDQSYQKDQLRGSCKDSPVEEEIDIKYKRGTRKDTSKYYQKEQYNQYKNQKEEPDQKKLSKNELKPFFRQSENIKNKIEQIFEGEEDEDDFQSFKKKMGQDTNEGNSIFGIQSKQDYEKKKKEAFEGFDRDIQQNEEPVNFYNVFKSANQIFFGQKMGMNKEIVHEDDESDDDYIVNTGPSLFSKNLFGGQVNYQKPFAAQTSNFSSYTQSAPQFINTDEAEEERRKGLENLRAQSRPIEDSHSIFKGNQAKQTIFTGNQNKLNSKDVYRGKIYEEDKQEEQDY